MVLAHERNKGGKLSVQGRSCDVLGRFRVLGFLLLEGSSPHPQLAGSRAARLRSNYSAAMTGVLGHQARQKRGAFFGVRGYALTGFGGILRRMTCLQVVVAPLI